MLAPTTTSNDQQERRDEKRFENTLSAAQALDAADPLAHFRSRFFIPQHNGNDAVYFTGNSLGLQPKSKAAFVQQELSDWATHGVEGHFKAKNPWVSYHEPLAKPVANLLGASEEEVVVMNQLTVNLHLLLATFYRPTKERFKIICEAKAFPSDQYALQSVVELHGFTPEEAIVEISTREGEYTIRTEDIVSAVQAAGNSVALVLFGGVNYYSGQVLDIQAITEAAHKVGAYAGFDLAHAVGNINLRLHDWSTLR